MPDLLVGRDKAALVVVDIQDRLADRVDEGRQVIAAAGRLMRAAALFGWPILVTRQYPEGLGGLVPEIDALVRSLSAEGAGPAVIDKVAFSCPAEPSFTEALSSAGRRQVILAGMETHICVAQTALALLEQGDRVFVAADACGSISPTDHDVALARMRAAGVTVTTSQAIMYEAAERAATDEFRALLGIVKGE